MVRVHLGEDLAGAPGRLTPRDLLGHLREREADGAQPVDRCGFRSPPRQLQGVTGLLLRLRFPPRRGPLSNRHGNPCTPASSGRATPAAAPPRRTSGIALVTPPRRESAPARGLH